MAGPLEKVCTNCGIDVSKKPRTKDAMGRYFCEPCDAKIQAAKSGKPASGTSQAKVAPPQVFEVEPMMDGLISQAAATPVDVSAVSTGVCDACSAPMPAGAKVCFSCGFNTETGKLLKTKVVKEKGPKRKLPRVSVHLGAGGSFLVATALLAIPFALWVNNPDERAYEALFFVTFGLLNILTAVMIVFTPFRDGEAGWGILILISFFIPVLGNILILYYLFGVTERGSVKGLYLACVLGSLGVVAMRINKEEMLDERPSGNSHSLIAMPHQEF